MKLAHILIATSLAACGVVEDDETDDDRQGLSGAARRPRAEAIRDAARSKGLTNGALLAGIAQVETVFSHCWSEARWACQGPYSSDCSGPVIAGAYDGPCSARQGGLGLFQFDAGTFDDTLRRDGQEILQIDGNVRHAVDFVANLIFEEVDGVESRADAVEWLNTVPIESGNPQFDRLGTILACRYRGGCRASDATKYKNGITNMVVEFGAAFWRGGGGPPPPPPPPPAPTTKYWVDTFADAPGRSSPGGAQTGTLNAGTNYVYCKTWGPEVRVGTQFNHYWMQTDLDAGNPWQRQWVSAYYLSRWGNDVAKDNSGVVLPDCP